MNGDPVPFRSLNSMLSFSVAEHRALNILSLKTKWLYERSKRLPPKMKCVQRAAWAARACGSWAQASWSEAGSQIEFCEEQSLSGCSLWSWVLMYAETYTSWHALTTEQRHARPLKVFSVKRCVAKELPQQWSFKFHCLSMKWFWIVHLLIYSLITCKFNLTKINIKIIIVNLRASCFYQVLRRFFHWETKHVRQNCWADMSRRYACICILSNSSHDATPDHSHKHASDATPVNKNKGASSYRNINGQCNMTRY